MGGLKSQKGFLSLGSLIFLLIVGSGIYVGIKMTLPWIRFYQIEELFKEQVVRLKVASEDEVKGAIKLKLEQLEVPLSIEDVRVIREEGKPAVIEGTYKADVEFIGGYKYTYIFKPRGEAPKSVGYN